MINDASLVMIPSGYKDGKLYSVKPTDGSGDFTFSRGSNLAATRVNSEGLIEKGRENLLLQSNQFDTTWTTTNANITGGQSGYDGSSNAWLFQSTSTLCRLNQSLSFTSIVTISVYAKSGTSSFLFLEYLGTVSQTWFNLTTGSVATTSNIIDANIQSIGDGWYRCSMTYNQSAVGELRIRISDSDNSNVTTSASTIYIQDAQLEQGLVATDYIETTTTTAQAGILEDMPRLNYGTCPSLLLEPQRSNLIWQSEYFGAWTTQTGITLTTNTTDTLSPEGFNNAYKVVSTDSTKGFYFGGLNVTNAAIRTIYLKGSVGGETVVLKDPSGFGTPTTKTLSTDWQRFEMATTNDGNTYQGLFIDDISVGTIYAYGAQLEEGSYPTSYIPTYGASVTRGEDVCVGGGDSSTFNDSEGVLFFEGSTLVETGEIRVISLSNGSTNNNIYFNFNANANSLNCEIKAGGSTQFNPYVTMTKLNNNKIAVKYKENDFALWINGVEVATDTSGTTPTGLDRLNFDFGQGSFDFKGNVKQILYFNTALSDSELAALTS
jgi:hypothetical protein